MTPPNKRGEGYSHNHTVDFRDKSFDVLQKALTYCCFMPEVLSYTAFFKKKINHVEKVYFKPESVTNV